MTLEVVFGSVVVLSIWGYLHHIKKKSDKVFDDIELMWKDDILSFVERNGLKGVDIQFKIPSDIKKKSNAKESIKFIGTTIPKGYDLIDSTFEKGYYFGPHIHRYSNELIYVIDGKIKVVLCKNTPDHCSICDDSCLLQYNETIIDDNLVDIKTLTDGQYVFMNSGQFHTFEALQDSRCIIITLPPISRGVL